MLEKDVRKNLISGAESTESEDSMLNTPRPQNVYNAVAKAGKTFLSSPAGKDKPQTQDEPLITDTSMSRLPLFRTF